MSAISNALHIYQGMTLGRENRHRGRYPVLIMVDILARPHLFTQVRGMDILGSSL